MRKLGLLAVSFTVAALASVSASWSAEGEAKPASCEDRAERLGDTNGDDDGEIVTVAPQGRPGRLISLWMSGAYPRTSVVLAQRDPKGKWSYERLSPLHSGDPQADSAPGSGTVYVGYLRSSQGPPFVIRRIVPGEPAGPEVIPAWIQVLDRPLLAVDQGVNSDRLYVMSGTIEPTLFISDDGGNTWSYGVPSPIGNEWHWSIASGGDTVLVATLGRREDPVFKVIPIDRKRGRFEAPVPVAKITRGAGRGDWIGGPMLSIVRDGPYVGRAYAVWPYQGEGSLDVDLYVSHSDDSGHSWSEPLQINNDEGGYNLHEYATVAAAPDGGAYVFWMDSRADPTDRSAEMYGAKADPKGVPGPNVKLADCPTYLSDDIRRFMGHYLSFDVVGGDPSDPDGEPAIVFPSIRAEGADVDPFFLQGGWGSNAN